MEHASFWRLALNEARDETDFAVAFQGFSVFYLLSSFIALQHWFSIKNASQMHTDIAQ
jgi:hypothetical protein